MKTKLKPTKEILDNYLLLLTTKQELEHTLFYSFNSALLHHAQTTLPTITKQLLKLELKYDFHTTHTL